MAILSDTEVQGRLTGMDGWSVVDGALHKRYTLPDFASAMAFADRVAEAAEAADHHPDILVSWGRVELSWVSHSEGGITERDVQMAARSDELLAG
ncbi:MAG: 4a-hydroxytetrahydrobiopterin dehydratase [Gaiellales bacterium]